MAECWRVIRQATKYSVSNLGKVKNARFDRAVKVVSNPATKTRSRVVLLVDGKVRNFYVHRLVADAFVDNPQGHSEVNHIDGDCYNNAASNLEWVSRQENMRHLYENGLRDSHRRGVVTKHRETGEEVTYDTLAQCGEALGVSPFTVFQSCRGKRRDSTYDFSYRNDEVLQHAEEPDDWTSYPEFPKYEVSKCGLVRHGRTKRIMQGSMVNGYKFVSLCVKKGQNATRLIHRMVAMTLIPNTEGKPYVDHIDSNCLNNRVENLRWVTHKENMNNPVTREKIKMRREQRKSQELCS